jgi:DNA-binding CsgD family transcriptional regulator
VIAPHLRAVYARTESTQDRERRLALLERGIESGGDLVVLVGRDGAITAAGPSARAMLGRWFEGGDGATLPPELDAWRRAGRGSPDPARIERRRGNARLRLRLVAGTQEDAILVSERRERPVDPALLGRRLPISHREAEVLALIVGGHINASIALELDLSPHTVARYVERLYAKLDVHNRAAATAAARDALEEWGEG